MPSRTQSSRDFAVATPLGDDALLLRRLAGEEGLGRMFSFELDLVSEDPNVPFEKLIGQNITVRKELIDGETRYFNGYVSRMVQTGISTYPAAAAGAPRTLASYSATVVPWLWFLTRVADCRIFQEMTVPDIIKDVFRTRGFADFDDSGLSGGYTEWEYCVQYRETDFDFISRLMEHEGIYYYFKHEDGKHTLMLVDSPSAHPLLPGYTELPFHAPGESSNGEECFTAWTLEKEIQPGVVALTDFDFVNPKNPLEAKAAISREHAVPDLEVFDFPGDYTAAADGETYARVRIEELQAQYEIGTGETDACGLASGYRLKLSHYPREDQNREYLITTAEYTVTGEDFESGSGTPNGNGRPAAGAPDEPEGDFECTFTAIPATQAFRAPRTTPKPSIAGPQTAIVVGKSGEEIWTDEHGRVKVQFHWDRYSQADETSSCWIRVSQNWAGKKWGAMFLPRIGQEVIVEFLEGDPDRPIITGRVYNGDNKAPYALPGEATKSGLKTLSSKGGAGFNEIRFEDKKGEEHIFTHAEKDLHYHTKNDRVELVLNDAHLIVKRDQVSKVEQDVHSTITRDHIEDIGRDHSLTVAGDQAVRIDKTHSITVTGNVAEVFKANHHEETTGDVYLHAENITIEAKTNITIKVGASTIAITADGIKIATDGEIVLDAKKDITQKTLQNFTMEATTNFGIKGTAGLVLESPATSTLKSPATTVKGDGTLTLSGGMVAIN